VGELTASASALGAPRAILVGVDIAGSGFFDPSLDELALLATSAGDEPVARVTAKRRSPDAALFVGSGKAEEIKGMVTDLHAQGVIFDQALSPVQQRNLEQLLGVPVSDRTALILDIFADRAQSHEGKLQVELPVCSTWPPAWCAGGRIWSAKGGVLAPVAVLVRPRSSSIAE